MGRERPKERDKSEGQKGREGRQRERNVEKGRERERKKRGIFLVNVK